MAFNQRHTGGGISYLTVLVGVALGIGLGLLYTWEIDPVIERNTAPWQLSDEAQEDYIVAAILSYAYNQDLNLVVSRLVALRPSQGIWNLLADVACDRHRAVKVISDSDSRIMRVMEELYRSQGASGCADGFYSVPEAVPTRQPSPTSTMTPTQPPQTPSKTPSLPPPTDTPSAPINLTPAPPPDSYEVYPRPAPFCDPGLNGTIQVQVVDRNGQGIPGVQVQVSWGTNNTQTFYTGLKPDRDAGYADFKMDPIPGRVYSVTLPGLTTESPEVEVTVCGETPDGDDVFASYLVKFQQRYDSDN